jgi:hypothetical protein
MRSQNCVLGGYMKRLVYFFFVLIAFVINVAAQDSHSYANPSAVRVRHVDLDWDVLCAQKILKGSVASSRDRRSSLGNLSVSASGCEGIALVSVLYHPAPTR